jgi:hypothetical protein
VAKKTGRAELAPHAGLDPVPRGTIVLGGIAFEVSGLGERKTLSWA